MNQIATNAYNDIQIVISKLNDVLGTKLTWKYTHTGGDELISLVSQIDKTKFDTIKSTSLDQWYKDTLVSNDYYIDVTTREYYDFNRISQTSEYSYSLFIYMSLNTDPIINKICDIYEENLFH